MNLSWEKLSRVTCGQSTMLQLANNPKPLLGQNLKVSQTQYWSHQTNFLIPAGNYMFKVNNRNTRTNVWNTFKVNNKASKTMPFIVKFEHISHLCSNVSIVNFEQVNAGWDYFTVMPFLLIMKKCITLLFTARIWASFTLAWNLQFVAFIS